jgi:hypothetical protein
MQISWKSQGHRKYLQFTQIRNYLQQLFKDPSIVRLEGRELKTK